MKWTTFALLLSAAALAAAIGCTSDARESEEHSERGSDDRRRSARVSPAVLAKGHGLYKATCAPCHGDSGKGDGPASKIFKPPPRDHTDAAYMNTITDEEMAKTIQMGGVLKGKPSMPSNPQIRGEDMTALVAYVRSLSQPSRK